MRKVGIDTNILLRLIVKDNPHQHHSVVEFGTRMGKDYTGYVTLISLVEIDYALRKHYGFAKVKSTEAIRRIIRIRGVEVQSPDAVIRALGGVEDGSGDFADLMITHLCLDAGCDCLVTLDKKAAAKIPAAVLLS